MRLKTLIPLVLTCMAALTQAAKPAELTSVTELRAKAEGGDVSAQINLGERYAAGDGVTKNFEEAVKWYRRAAQQGNGEAQYRLGYVYEFADGAAKDSKEAVKWLRKAVDQEHSTAQFLLAFMYENGAGVPKDLNEAVKWMRKSAEHGDPTGQNGLGTFYSNGIGVPKDKTEAGKWFRKAAEQGDASSQHNLALLYERGEGIVKDQVEALAWYYVSASDIMRGGVVAVKKRDILERRLGQQAALVAQQRSKEILKHIEANKARSEEGVSTAPRAQNKRDGAPKSTGSGTIVSFAGHILTAAHVIADAARINVVTARGMKRAMVLRVDEPNDLAVLKVVDGTYAALSVAPSRSIRLGQAVATIGFPNVEIQGFSPKLTRGEISSLNGIGDDPRSWQISVPVQPGNSGGPLLDENGNLIGVVLAKLGLEAAKATGDLPQNVGYAVKSTYALALLEPYLNSNAPEPNTPDRKLSFEDMVAKAQQSVVLILVY